MTILPQETNLVSLTIYLLPKYTYYLKQNSKNSMKKKKQKKNIKNKLHNKYGKIKHLMTCDRSNLPVTFENKMPTFKCDL
jgi:hypothetical protein